MAQSTQRIKNVVDGSKYSVFSKFPIATTRVYTAKELDEFSGCSWLRSYVNNKGKHEDEFRIITRLDA